MSDFHWQLRRHLKEFRPDGRLYVLLSIYLHKNTRNRSWPSNDLIAEETGLSRAPISRSIEWLKANHAVILVPYSKRIGNEKELPNRKNIYQLTGVIRLNGQYRPYMYLSPEGWAGILQEIKDIEGDSLDNELLNEINSLQIERSHSEHSHSEPKGITGIKDSTEKKEDIRANKSRSRDQQSDIQNTDGRDLVFDAVAEHIFNINPLEVNKETGGRIGVISSWLNGKSDGLKRNGGKVGYISRPAEPEHVKRFAAWYKAKHPNISMPRDLLKFVDYWRQWASEQSKAAAARPAPAPEPEITEAQRAELLEAVRMIRPEWEALKAS